MTTNIGHIVVPANEVAGRLTATVTVKGMRRFNLRCTLGLWLLRVAGWVFPFHVDVEIES